MAEKDDVNGCGCFLAIVIGLAAAIWVVRSTDNPTSFTSTVIGTFVCIIVGSLIYYAVASKSENKKKQKESSGLEDVFGRQSVSIYVRTEHSPAANSSADIVNAGDSDSHSRHDTDFIDNNIYKRECNEMSKRIVGFIERMEADDEFLEFFYKSVNGLESFDRLSGRLAPGHNIRLTVVVLLDFIRCYRALDLGFGSLCPEMLTLTLTIVRLTDSNNDLESIGSDRRLEIHERARSVLETLDTIVSCDQLDGDIDSAMAKLLEADEMTKTATDFREMIYQFSLLMAKADGNVSAKEVKLLDRLKKLAFPDESDEPVVSATGGDPIGKLEVLIGLDGVKEEVDRLVNFIKVQQMRVVQGLKTVPVSYHCVFTGNPGTGKTTVARIIAEIYKDLGILKKGHLVETDRSGLVAEYVGQTAVKTNKIIDKALDGVLFIDEAYSLVSRGDNDYGAEAVATLLKRMEDDRSRLVVILAGYEDEMKDFIDSNPGLQSRFNRYIYFEDYSTDELFRIFLNLLIEHDYRITSEASELLREGLERKVRTKDRNFGNARFVRNLFEKTLERQASRLTASVNPSRDDLQRINAEDIVVK